MIKMQNNEKKDDRVQIVKNIIRLEEKKVNLEKKLVKLEASLVNFDEKLNAKIAKTIKHKPSLETVNMAKIEDQYIKLEREIENLKTKHHVGDIQLDIVKELIKIEKQKRLEELIEKAVSLQEKLKLKGLKLADYEELKIEIDEIIRKIQNHK
jgi:hypothetical protein